MLATSDLCTNVSCTSVGISVSTEPPICIVHRSVRRLLCVPCACAMRVRLCCAAIFNALSLATLWACVCGPRYPAPIRRTLAVIKLPAAVDQSEGPIVWDQSCQEVLQGRRCRVIGCTYDSWDDDAIAGGPTKASVPASGRPTRDTPVPPRIPVADASAPPQRPQVTPLPPCVVSNGRLDDACAV